MTALKSFPIYSWSSTSRSLDLFVIVKSKTVNQVSNLGTKIRSAREKRSILLRQVAAHIEVDTGFMSKAERGERNLNRDQVIRLAEYLQLSEDELLVLWLCDKVIDTIGNDPLATKGVKLALTKLNALEHKLEKH